MGQGYSSKQVSSAFTLLQRGQVEEAQAIFSEILRANPTDAEALHGMACVARLGGRPDLAIGFVGQALQQRPDASHFYITLGHALFERGHREEARAAFHSAVLYNSADARAHSGHAMVLEAMGRLEDAQGAFEEAAAIEPLNIVYHIDLSRFFTRHHRPLEALAVFDNAIARYPEQPMFHHERAVLLSALSQPEEAVASFRSVTHLLPQDAAAHANLGAALLGINHLDEAREQLERARDLQPESAETQSNLGLVYMALGFLPQAQEVLYKAFCLAPQDVRVANNYATTLAELGDMDKAEELYRNILSRHEARAEPLPLHYEQARFNLGTLLLSRGDYQQGWELFESRLKIQPPMSWHQHIRSWDGNPLPSGRVFVCMEQGLGDFIQFLRYIPHMAQHVAIILEVPDSCERLVRRRLILAGVPSDRVQIVKAGSLGPLDIAAQCPLFSLPRLLGLQEPPPFSAYIGSYPQDRMEGPVHVGICWAGNPSYRFDRRRSLPLHMFKPLMGLESVKFFSLQKGWVPGRDDEGMALVPLPDGDMEQTAATIDDLDVVISVDTAVAHLAAAMGKPVWLLNRFGGDWRWQKGAYDHEDYNLWYPSVVQFRQSGPFPPTEGWGEALDELEWSLKRIVHFLTRNSSYGS